MYELFPSYEIDNDMEQWGRNWGRSEPVYRTSVNYDVRSPYLSSSKLTSYRIFIIFVGGLFAS